MSVSWNLTHGKMVKYTDKGQSSMGDSVYWTVIKIHNRSCIIYLMGIIIPPSLESLDNLVSKHETLFTCYIFLSYRTNCSGHRKYKSNSSWAELMLYHIMMSWGSRHQCHRGLVSYFSFLFPFWWGTISMVSHLLSKFFFSFSFLLPGFSFAWI